MVWDGKERRSMDRDKNSDHDTLIQMVQILKNHVSNFDIHRDDFLKHKNEDDTNFKRIDRTIYIATGIATVVVFLVNVGVKFIK